MVINGKCKISSNGLNFYSTYRAPAVTCWYCWLLWESLLYCSFSLSFLILRDRLGRLFRTSVCSGSDPLNRGLRTSRWEWVSCGYGKSAHSCCELGLADFCDLEMGKERMWLKSLKENCIVIFLLLFIL